MGLGGGRGGLGWAGRRGRLTDWACCLGLGLGLGLGLKGNGCCFRRRLLLLGRHPRSLHNLLHHLLHALLHLLWGWRQVHTPLDHWLGFPGRGSVLGGGGGVGRGGGEGVLRHGDLVVVVRHVDGPLKGLFFLLEDAHCVRDLSQDSLGVCGQRKRMLVTDYLMENAR